MTLNEIAKLMETYLASKKNAWTAATLRSERARLSAILPHLDGQPATLWAALQGKAPYTRQTTFVRVGAFWEAVTGSSVYQDWRRANRQLFLNSYQRKLPMVSFEEARALLLTISHGPTRTKALQLLEGGLRFTESSTLKDGRALGKGMKFRRVYVLPVADVSYSRVYRALKELGLTPHMLRKLFASKMARAGLRDTDLCALMGWEDISTAQYYLQPMEEERMGALVAGALRKEENETEQAS